MKKYSIFLASLIIAGTAMAQPKSGAARTSAYMALDHWLSNTPKDPAELKKAMDMIDIASSPESTVSGEAKTWAYRGKIYEEAFGKDLADQSALLKEITDPGKRQMTAFQKVAPDKLMLSVDAYLKCKELDTKNAYSGEYTVPGLQKCNFYLQNMGVSRYNQKEYSAALPIFEKAISTYVTGKVDTGLYVNTANCALYGKDYSKALQYYNKLADMKYGKAHTYYQIAQIYKGMNDEAKAKETIAKGLAIYPNDSELLVEDVNDLIKQGKMAEAVNKLNTIVNARPQDGDLRLIVGQVYSRMANPNDAEGKPAPKPANFEELIAKSEEQLLKAVELKPTAYEPLYELSYLYYNQGAEYYNRSNSTIKDAAKYSTMWEAPIKKGIEWQEKALKVNPKDRDIMNMLKTSYGQIGDTENYNRIKEMLKK